MNQEKRFRIGEFYAVVWIVVFLLTFYLLPQLMDFSWPFLLRFIAASNIAAFLLYGLDKLQAITRRARVPEKLLLLAAFAGGPLGALLAMNLFRHKTRKASFQLWLALVLLAEGVIVWWFVTK